jgi:hypothetical protein
MSPNGAFSKRGSAGKSAPSRDLERSPPTGRPAVPHHGPRGGASNPKAGAAVTSLAQPLLPSEDERCRKH